MIIKKTFKKYIIILKTVINKQINKSRYYSQFFKDICVCVLLQMEMCICICMYTEMIFACFFCCGMRYFRSRTRTNGQKNFENFRSFCFMTVVFFTGGNFNDQITLTFTHLNCGIGSLIAIRNEKLSNFLSLIWI